MKKIVFLILSLFLCSTVVRSQEKETLRTKETSPVETPKSKDGTAKAETTDDGEEDIFMIVEVMPKFQDGDLNTFRNYVMTQLVYPEEARTNGIQGTVYLQFVVSSRGYVKKLKVVRSVHTALDAEALRVVKSSPRWEPGLQRGKAVAVQFVMPINFQLQ